LFERPQSGEKAVLVHVDFPANGAGNDVEELRELIRSAGADPVAGVTAARDAPDSRYFVGSGKAAEIRESVAAHGAEVVIFNHSLSPAQERNLERFLECRVLDRISLILDIFAQRASTFEGKLQVELAQLKHLSTRLVRGWTHLERQKGGIGLRGPGEKQLEMDRRLIRVRIRHIDERLARVRRRRALSRRARGRAALPVVSLVGYTNAGKSTLFNRLTGAGVLTEDRLFATLDPTLRRLELGGGATVVLADTVGFIRNLPHELVAAFRATLEETRTAALLLHVIDAAAPDRDAKREQVNRVLAEIGAADVPQLEVYNKTDLLEGAALAGAPERIDRDEDGRARRVWVSSREGSGLAALADAIRALGAGRATRVRRRVRLPLGAGRLRARLFELGTVMTERAGDDGAWVMEVEIAPAALERLCRSEGLDRACIAA